MKKWIPQYGVAVVKNKKMSFCQFLFNTEKALLTSKQSSFVLFQRVVLTTTTELYEYKGFDKNKNENNSQFCHFLVSHLGQHSAHTCNHVANINDCVIQKGLIYALNV